MCLMATGLDSKSRVWHIPARGGLARHAGSHGALNLAVVSDLLGSGLFADTGMEIQKFSSIELFFLSNIALSYLFLLLFFFKQQFPTGAFVHACFPSPSFPDVLMHKLQGVTDLSTFSEILSQGWSASTSSFTYSIQDECASVAELHMFPTYLAHSSEKPVSTFLYPLLSLRLPPAWPRLFSCLSLGSQCICWLAPD